MTLCLRTKCPAETASVSFPLCPQKVLSFKVRMVDQEHWEVALYHLVRRIPSMKIFLPLPPIEKGPSRMFGQDKPLTERFVVIGMSERMCGKKNLKRGGRVDGGVDGPTNEEMVLHLRQQAVL